MLFSDITAVATTPNSVSGSVRRIERDFLIIGVTPFHLF